MKKLLLSTTAITPIVWSPINFGVNLGAHFRGYALFPDEEDDE